MRKEGLNIVMLEQCASKFSVIVTSLGLVNEAPYRTDI
jgi:hypothetical protein